MWYWKICDTLPSFDDVLPYYFWSLIDYLVYYFKINNLDQSINTGAKNDWDFRISDLVKNLDGTYLTPGWISVKSNTLSLTPRWDPWDLFRSFEVCSDAKERVGCRKQRKVPHLCMPSKTAILILSLRWKTCLWAEHCWWWWWYSYTLKIT